MTEKFTPGPWVIEQHNFMAPEISGNGRPVARALYDIWSEDPEVDANAALIATAPELYEALVELSRVYELGDFDTEFKPALEQARAALKKARGEESTS